MDIKEIKTLIAVMEESSLTALEVEVPELKVRLERNLANSMVEVVQQPVYSMPAGVPAAAQAPAPAPSPAAAAEAPAKENAFYKEIKSPMVGVFYTASAPEADPYVTKGSQVKKGDVVCIIEAMKLMNEIPSEVDGTVAEICVGNGQVVEYNQPLFRIV